MTIDKHILVDAFNVLLSDKLGEGIGRTVYATPLDKDLVVKVEVNPHSFQNVLEWETWRTVEGTKHERWFAPCFLISPNGRVLVQRRTTPLAHKDYPRELPVYFTDIKRENFGMIKDQFVAHDYGVHNMLMKGHTMRMHEVNWGWRE